MRKILLLACAVMLIISCGKNDDNTPSLDGECRGIIDYTPSGIFFIELIDPIGSNLIENGFYNTEKITTSINGGAEIDLYD